MARFGFTSGGTYTSESPNVAAQRCVNWYPENTEIDATTPVALYPTPGLSSFANLTGAEVRGMYEFNGRLFVVTDKFYEVFSDGTYTGYSFLPDDKQPVTMAANNAGQLLICAAGELWMFLLSSPVTASVSSIQVSPQIRNIPERLFLNLTGASPFSVGQVVYVIGNTHLTALNGESISVDFLNGNTIISQNGSWIGAVPSNYGPTADTGIVSSNPAGTQFSQVTDGLQGPVSEIAFVDGYFIALMANSQNFQISNLEDALTWNPINVYEVSEFADNVVSMIVNQRQIFFFGQKQSVGYYDSGDPLTPFQPIPGAFIEQGCVAQWSVCRMDNSVFWLGQDERGQGIAWRFNGYTPTRVSNFAIENAWRKYTSISDAIAFTYQQNGHIFWQIWFPSGDATWVYDAATGQWHERTCFINGIAHAHLARCQAFAFGQVLVGDRSDGNVYVLDIANMTDYTPNGEYPIQRIRRAPHISNEQEWMFHQQLQVYLETGIANVTYYSQPGVASARAPIINLRWSDDGGHTWSNYYPVSAGTLGQYKTRCMWRRLGRARDRIYEISCTDPVPWRIVDSYLIATPGFQAQQRLVDRIKQGA